MRIIKPARLKKRDLIGLISPASAPEDMSSIEKGTKYLESLGYQVIIGKNVGKTVGYMAGTDQERIDDIHFMFKKKEVKAVFCLRGGYGTPRLLDKINYKVIRNNPKIFVGYSDITALQMAFFQKTGLITFAGPMTSVDFHNGVDPFTEKMFWKILSSKKKIGKVSQPANENLFHLNKGIAKGRIIGGNLSVFSSLIGTPYMPSLKEKILLLEEIGEMPYKVDRMLSQLKLSKTFAQVKGVILGAFKDCNEHDPLKKTLTLGEVVGDYFQNMKIPVAYNFKHGHLKSNITVPIGIMARLNASRGTIEFTESAVI
jgi:muramoyltetrapeptide carboxypeptidase